MNEQQYQEKLSKLSFPDGRLRVFGGFFLNALDIPLAPVFLIATGLQVIQKDVGAGIVITLMGAAHLGLQIFLATKGYTISKVLLGRKVLDQRTLEKASPGIILLRPIVAQAWMYAMIFISLAAAMFGAAFASIFHSQGNSAYDRAYNNAVTSSMATASTGFVWRTLYKYPKMTWLHDTICKTVVVSVPYKQVKAELQGLPAPITKVENKSELKKVA